MFSCLEYVLLSLCSIDTTILNVTIYFPVDSVLCRYNSSRVVPRTVSGRIMSFDIVLIFVDRLLKAFQSHLGTRPLRPRVWS